MTTTKNPQERREGAALILESAMAYMPGGYPWDFYIEFCRALARDVRLGLYDGKLEPGPETAPQAPQEAQETQEHTTKCLHHTHPIFPF